MIRRLPLRLAAITLSFCLVVWLTYQLGPRHEVVEPSGLPALPADPVALEAMLSNSERLAAASTAGPITPGTEKTIIWAYPDRRKTALSIIYLHGYSATRQEVSPLTEQLATALGANLFHTRLRGHGLPGDAMASASAGDWLRDTLEAYAVGTRIGERVIVVGTSTGGTLALWLAQHSQARDLAALLLISPNLGPRDARSEWLAGPWGAQLAEAIVGPYYEWQPANPTHARYWTWRYPTSSLIPMMALVDHVRSSHIEAISVPTLVLYSPKDRVVSHEQIETMFERLGTQAVIPAIKERIAIDASEDPSSHVLAGDVLAPSDTAAILHQLQKFVNSLTVSDNRA